MLFLVIFMAIRVTSLGAVRQRESATSRSEFDQHLERLALVHRSIAVRHLVERPDAVEYAAGLDPPVEDVREQLLDVRPHWRGATTNARVLPEHDARGHALVLGSANAADGAARASDLERGDDRLLEADTLEDGVRAEAAGQLANALDRLLAALADHI